MLRKRFKIFSVAVLLSQSMYAQTINPGVLSSGGGSAASGGVQLDWILGEPFANTGIDSKAIVTQGFLQPELQVWTGTVNMPAWGTCQLSIPYTVSGVVDPGNVFTAELSDANGNFANPIVLGTATGNTNGVINGVVPETVPAGKGYRVRVRSSLPYFIGVANESDLAIRKPSIPDAVAYGAGVQANTIYQGWAPASSLILKADPNGAANPAYVWRNSKGKEVGTGSQLTVTQPDTYTVTVTANGCSATAFKTVGLLDAGCGTKQAPRVLICQKSGGRFQTTCVLPSAVAFYLQTGSQLAACSPAPSSGISAPTIAAASTHSDATGRFAMTAYPNPATAYFSVQLQSDNARDKIIVRVLDLNGKPIEVFTNLSAQQVIRFGDNYVPGMYVVEMVQGQVRTQLKVIKQRN